MIRWREENLRKGNLIGHGESQLYRKQSLTHMLELQLLQLTQTVQGEKRNM